MSVSNEEKVKTEEKQAVNASRRKVITASSLLMAAGLLGKPRLASADRRRRARLVLDVACLGHSFAPDFTGTLNRPAGDFRGTSFYVEGLIYPGGTIMPGMEFDIDNVPAMGHWFCRGWFMSFAERPEPGVITSQEYLLGLITPETLSPPNTIASSGVENGAPGLPAVRAVIGGTGRWKNARGEVVQETIGTNTTVLNVFGAPAPTFRFHFKLGEEDDD